MKLTAQSNDAQIVKFLSSVNKKITGYYKTAGNEVGEEFAHRVEQTLSYRKYTKGEFGVYEEWELPLEEKKGKLQIDLKTKLGKQTAIAHMRRVLAEAEAKQAATTVQDKLEAMPTVQQKIEQVKEQLIAQKSFSDATLKAYEDSDMKKREYNKASRQQALTEMQYRASMDYSDTDFDEVLDMMYEDEEQFSDILGKLRKGQWTGDIMEEANVAVIGFNPKRR